MQEKRYEAIGETIYETKLPNGLQLYIVPRPGYAKQFAFFAVNYGGIDLTYTWNGTARSVPAGGAHFLEHKLFDMKDGSADLKLAAGGAISNAFTSPGMTAYYFECTDRFAENLNTLLNFVLEPYFTEESIQKEQGIIGQEIEMGEDDPDVQGYYQLLECLYHQHPIKDRVIGTVESIASLTPACLYECHEAFYNLDNMVLCIAGDLETDRVVRSARQIKKKSGILQHHLPEEEPPYPVRSRAEREMEISTPQFYLGFKGDGKTEDPLLDEIQSQLAFELLCGGSSPLYASLYERGLIDETFGGGYARHPGCSFFWVGGESRDPDAVAEAFFRERERVLQEGLDEAMFERQKKASFGKRLQGLDSMETMCVALAEGYFQSSDQRQFPQKYRDTALSDIEAKTRTAFAKERAGLSGGNGLREKEGKA